MLSKFTLIIPESEMDFAYFRFLGAKMNQMPGWCSDLKYAVGMGVCAWELRKQNPHQLNSIKQILEHRSTWLAVKIHQEELSMLIEVHKSLSSRLPGLLSFFSLINSDLVSYCLLLLNKEGIRAEIWSPEITNYEQIDLFIIDQTQNQNIAMLSTIVETIFIAGSLLPEMPGHNLAEFAISGSAIITGKHLHQFNNMAEQINYCAVLAAEEVEFAVLSAVGRISEDSEEEEGVEMERPPDGLFHQLSSQTPSSPLSFIAEVVLSSPRRPMTAPPDYPRSTGSSLRRILGPGDVGHLRRRNYSSTSNTPVNSRLSTPGFRDFQQTAFLEQDRFPPPLPPERNLSRASCPNEPLQYGLMENDEDPGQREGYHRSYSALESIIQSPEEHIELYPDSDLSSPTPVHDLKVLGLDGEYVIPATHLPFGSDGPGVWMVSDEMELEDTLYLMLTDPLQRRSRGQAAAQGAARLVIGLILELWTALDECLFENVLYT
eukprot:g3678.t1